MLVQEWYTAWLKDRYGYFQLGRGVPGPYLNQNQKKLFQGFFTNYWYSFFFKFFRILV